MSDYVVVGSGPAGCIMAARLSEDPDVTVTLIEAGGRDSHPLIHMPAGFARMTKGIASWGWHTVPQKHLNGRVLRFTQGKVIGGGSSINAQVYTRGHGADYDHWADNGCDGWRYRDILPYFKRAEDNQRFLNDYHAEGGPIGVSNPVSPLPVCEAFFKAAQEMGIPYNPDFNGAQLEGVGYYQLTQRDAKRSSAARGYLTPNEGRANLTIRPGAEALKVVIEHGRAVGVEVRVPSGTETIPADREVIIACGAVGSPKLLLQSGIGPAGHLNDVGIPVVHDLPGVGENLQDHLDIFTICECTGDHTYDSYGRIDKTILAGLQYVLFKTGPAASSLFETGGFWFADRAATRPDIQMHLGLGSGIEAGVAKLKNAGITLNSAFLHPRSRGTVKLASNDPSASPLIDPNYWSVAYDRDMALRGLALIREIMAQEALKPYIAREVLPGPDIVRDDDIFDYACANAKTDHHPVGTCKMGIDDMAVVTPDLKVRGIEGLRVADSSIMPTLPSCNTNAPTIMIGERACDIIRGLDSLPPAVFSGNIAR